MYKEGIVVARSRKKGGYCLVIFDTNEKRFYRIISDGIRNDQELLKNQCYSNNGNLVELLDVVRVHIKQTAVNDYLQPENIIIDSQKCIEYLGKTNKRELIRIYGGVNNLNYTHDEIFCNPYSSMRIDEARLCGYSFMFARVFSLKFYATNNSNGELSCKASFKYNGIDYDGVSVTISDTKEEDILKYAKSGKNYPVAYVCFSFGHPYENKCHKYLCSFLGYDMHY